MVLKLDIRDVVFFAGGLCAAAGLWITFGVGPVLIAIGALAAAGAKFLEVRSCSSNG